MEPRQIPGRLEETLAPPMIHGYIEAPPSSEQPAITKAQIYAALGWAVAQALAWGWIGNDVGQQIVAVGGTVLSAAWMVADVLLRQARNKRHAAEVQARAGTRIVAGTNLPIATIEVKAPPATAS